MLWDLHKARAHKRKKKLMRERHKKMIAFIGNMYEAYKHYTTFDQINESTFWKNVYSMPTKYALWVSSKIHYDMDKTPLNEEDMAMDEMCRLMQLWRETSTKKREAQEEAIRLAMQERAIHALFRHKMRKYKI